jgi:hypothetical protein
VCSTAWGDVAKQFYEAVLPPTGTYCAVGILHKKVVHTFHSSFDELIKRGVELEHEGFNAYFALATFRDADAGRKATNTVELRSLFLDVDCGYGKPYRDKIAGGQALRAFIEKRGLPEPVVVDSGRGLHVYWPLTQALETPDWKQYGARLKQTCVNEGFSVDPVVPTDAARVLRMPDTKNFKDRSPLPVLLMTPVVAYDVEEVARCLDEVAAATIDLSAARAYGLDDLTKQIANRDFPPSAFSRIAARSLKGTGCGQIKYALLEAETLEEPLWRAALSIAWQCTDAEVSIHKLSEGHPEYSFEETVKKAENTRGPMTCAWYKQNYPQHCEGCTHSITSPIQLGRKIDAAPVQANGQTVVPTAVIPVIPAYPWPYFRPATGGVYRKDKDKDGDPIEIKVYDYDLYPTARYYDSDEHGEGDGELVNLRITSPQDGVRSLTVPLTTLMAKEKARELLNKHGVVAMTKQLDEIMAYFATSIRDLQKKHPATRMHNQMGWTPDLSRFVVGETEYTALGTKYTPASLATRSIAPYLTQKGSLEEWRKVVDFYAQPGMEAHALAVFFGFGAILLKLVGGIEVQGATINLMSNRSGTGKTTAQMVVNSIFGHPNALLMRKNDTLAAKIQWMGMLNTIAATMDEVTNVTDEELSNMVYDIPQGRGRNRMESQVNKLRINKTSWSTFLITSSNSSLYDKLSRLKSTADGELRRLIELRITRPLTITKAESDAIFGKLQHHYGMAGPLFVTYVMNNLDKVRAFTYGIQAQLDRLLNNQQQDRYYSLIGACGIAGGHITRDLNLHNIPVEPVLNYLIATLNGIQVDVLRPAADASSIAVEALSSYISENLHNALVVNGNRIGNAAPIARFLPRGPLRFRFEPDTGLVWIPTSALKEYFTERQIDVRSAVSELASMGYLSSSTAIMKRIAAGALEGLESSAIRCYQLPASVVGVDANAFEKIASPTAPASGNGPDNASS